MNDNGLLLITFEEAKTMLCVSSMTLSRYIKAGKISYYQVGRRKLFRPEELLAESRKPKTSNQ